HSFLVNVLFGLFSSVIMSIEAAEPGYIARLPRFWHDPALLPVGIPLCPRP
ncbi:Protein Daple, partial [Nibea albiflora]